MGTFSIWHWIIVLAVILLLFGGRGKIPNLMRDMGQGINAFKRGLKEEDKDKVKADDTTAEPKKAIETEPEAASATVEEKDTAASG
ncbi:MAG: twin-arginine translocase TatA/TatE family subunit [Proteobacteria bacterium]|nr:twin-arginine translocase TatA/TatE family subunit [Pseudomonadota bacterium]MCH8997571.1 twin-arginine translocase TatA/TatE family subunit [Pseudomonadota bacterium]